MEAVFKHIDTNEAKYIQRLSEVVAIQSVSAWPHARPEVRRMVEWTKTELERLGATCELEELGDQTLPDGTKLPLPPVLLGTLGHDPKKKTLLVYGHLDVQPAEKEDGWDTEPFVLTEKDGKLYGRGATDDKGPVLAWSNCIEAMQELGQEVPINIKFMLEGMEESGSEGLDELIMDQKNTFLKGVDYVCISDNYWLGKKKPCITYGLRGICYFFVEIECAAKDLHSGIFGGTVHEAMTDLIAILGSLVDVRGKILIPGINDSVKPLTDDEEKTYGPIDFDKDEYQADIGAKKLIHEKKEHVLMARWRYPSLSVHGIEGAFSATGAKTVIPRKVIGKFSIRLVPDMLPDQVEKLVNDHIGKLHKDSGSPNSIRISMGHGGKPWVSDFNDPNYIAGRNAVKTANSGDPDETAGYQPAHLDLHCLHTFSLYRVYIEGGGGRPWVSDYNHPNYVAGRNAVKKVFGVEPDLTREGGSIPVTLTFQEATGKNVMLLPIGASDDGAHSQNEKIDKSNYINGIKLLGAYMDELGKLE